MSPQTPFTAVILAAGKGTRMRSSLIKVLHPLCGRSMLGLVMDACRAAGAARIVVVVGHQREAVEAAVAAPDVAFAVQEEQLGTGHALLMAAPALRDEDLDRPLLVLPGDVPLVRAELLGWLMRQHGTRAATVLGMVPPDAAAYGRLIQQDGALHAIVEARDATPEQLAVREVNSGVYVFEGRALFGAGGVLGALRADNDQAELYLTDAIALLRERGRAVGAAIWQDAVDLTGINDRVALSAAEKVLRGRLLEQLMRDGVHIVDPDSCYPDVGVQVGPDTVLSPGVVLQGDTRIGSGVVVGPHCTLRDSTVGDGARLGTGVVLERADVGPGNTLLPYSVLSGHNHKRSAQRDEERVVLDRGARIGPFSHLRPGARIEQGAHVGNFVELKATTLGPGAKANHLAYLGDTTIGAGANIGAGVITCNYDGFAKHQTIIEEGAFVGSDCQLIAPLRVGRGAYIATGATVTKDIPADALAIGRARMVVREGRATLLKRKLAQRAGKPYPPAATAKKEESGA